MTEIRKIRIGNDIRLAVDLRQYINLPKNPLKEREVYTPDNENFENFDPNDVVNKETEVYYDKANSSNWPNLKHVGRPISIRTVKAVLVNTTREQEYIQKLEKKTRFVARFPIEPGCENFNSTYYDICNSGYPAYRIYPGRYYATPYHGYGIYPNFGALCKKPVSPMDFKYVAEAYATEEQHVVEISFPASDQKYTGTYSLIIVAQVYAPGFNSKNLKTITVDIPNVFDLVSTTEEGVNTGIAASVTDVIDNISYEYVNPYIDVFVENGNYENGSLQLSRTDGQNVNIDLSEATGWYEGD